MIQEYDIWYMNNNAHNWEYNQHIRDRIVGFHHPDITDMQYLPDDPRIPLFDIRAMITLINAREYKKHIRDQGPRVGFS